MIQKRNTFSKEERLSGKITIDELFDSGKSFFVYPLLIIYKEKQVAGGSDISLLISVSKKKFKLAVDRNRIKRQIREFYRVNKHELKEKIPNARMDIALVYVGRKELPSSKLDLRLKEALNLLIEKLND